MDLVHIDSRTKIHVDLHGKCHITIYPLDAASTNDFFDWIIHNVKFSDMYASNLCSYVDKSERKFISMESHDSHVMMQHLLLFTFFIRSPQNATAGTFNIDI